jgi:hypothetical protein
MVSSKLIHRSLLVLSLISTLIPSFSSDTIFSPYESFWNTPSVQEISLEQMLGDIRDSSPESKRSKSEIRSNASSLIYQELRFTPSFSSTFGYREATWYNNYYDPKADNPYKYSEDYARGFNSNFGFTQPIHTGGKIELQMFNNYSEDKWAYAKDSNGNFTRPLQEQMSSLTRVNLVQPILKNAGWEANERPELIQCVQLELTKARAKENLISRQAEFLKLYYQYSHYYRESENWIWLQKQFQNIARSNPSLAEVQTGLFENRNRFIYSQMKTLESRFLLRNYRPAPAGLEQSLFVPEMISPPLSFSWQDSYQKFQANYHHRPELHEAKLWKKSQELQLESIRNELKPNMDVYGNYGLRGIGSDIDSSISTSVESPTPEWGAGFTFSIPLGEQRDLERLKMTQEGLYQAEQNLLKVESQLSTNASTSLTRLAFYFDQWMNANESLQKTTPAHQISELPPLGSLDEIKQVRPVIEAFNRESWARYEYLRNKVEFEQNAGILFHDRPDLTDLDFKEKAR